MKNYWTQKEAASIIEAYKNATAWFDDDKAMKFDDMYEMLRIRMGFSMAEANIILAALIKCGAKIV